MGEPVAVVVADWSGEKRLAFWCPACDEAHHVVVRAGRVGAVCWGWNDSLERPTFTPSILVTRPAVPGSSDAKRREALRCHSFVMDGRIAYCGDSAHALAGLTVALAPPPEPWRSIQPFRGPTEAA